MKKRILSTLLAFCMVLSLLPGTALAATVDSGSCGTFTNWTLDSDGTLTISGTGSIADEAVQPWRKYSSEIRKVVVNSGVTRLGYGSFFECRNLIDVRLPNTLTIIGKYAFHNCTSLPSISIPNSVTNIEEYAFYWCSALTTLAIPSGVISLGNGAFYGCGALVSVTLPSTVVSIGEGTFSRCSKLRTITIPNSVTSIGASAFEYCSALTKITIPQSVVSLGNDVFYYCTGLSNATILGDVDIGFGLFNMCSNLKSVTLSRGLTSIADWAFRGCDKLSDIYFAGSEAEWNTITVGSANSALTKVTMHYNSGGSDEPETYTVTFDPNDGSTSATEKEYKANATLGTLPTPTRSGYKFSGWYTAETGGTKVTSSKKVTADMTLYAHWTKTTTTKTYTIKLDANSGKVAPSSIQVESGKTYFSSLPTPTRTGWKFAGWYTTRTGGTKITSATKATANRTLYAHWTRAKTYMVTFDANGGMVHLDRKVVPSGVLYRDLPTPTKNNSHFQGWYTKKTGGTKVTANSRTNLTADQTLYARWQSSASVRSTQRGTYRVTIPAYYELALYTSNNSAKIASEVETTGYQTITCTQRVTLSNDTVRYYGKVNNRNCWFTYSCEMDVN